MSRANPRFHRTNPFLPAISGFNVVMLTIFGTFEAQLTLNILYYQDQTGTVASIANLNAFLSAWKLANQTFMLACSSSDWAVTQYKAQYVNAVGIIPQYLAVVGGAGTGAAPHEPTTVAAILSKYSMVKGQSGRGRYYIPAVPTQVVLLSALTPAGLNTNQVYGGSINTPIVGAGVTYTSGVFSRRGYNKVTGTGGGFSPLTTCTARALLGNVRRRRIGRGK